MSCRRLRVFLGLYVTVQCLQVASAASVEVGNRTRTGSQECRRPQFECRNGACIDGILMCDGALDCPDGSDETSQACINTVVCPSYAFLCDYGGCVNAEAKCNGKADCADGSDERGCPEPEISGVKCRKTEFQCKSGQCIDNFFECDGNKDCEDGSDETKAVCGSFICPGYAFTCAYGACIDSDGRCNGVDECADGSDESSETCGWTKHPPVTQRPTLPSETTTTTTPQPPGGQCILPQPPENGRYIMGNCEGDRCPPPGTRLPFAFLIYTCNPGYTITGTQIAYCAQGTWYSQPPTCSIVTCDPLESLSRDITCSLNHKEVLCSTRLPVGTIADVKCKIHYQQVPELSSYQMVCQSNGRWSRELTSCIPVCGVRNLKGVPFISHGVKAKFTEFPWHVGIYQIDEGEEHLICGGTLISSRVIISAAHCFYDDENDRLQDKSNYRVVVGKYFRDWNKTNKYMQVGEIENIVVPERYRGKILNYESDIAVINLKVELEFNVAVRPICLDRERKYENLQLSDGNVGAVVGWGVTEQMEPSPELMTAYLPYVNFRICYHTVPETFRQFLRKDKFCAGHLNGTSVCPGDSGGGLAFEHRTDVGSRWYLQGIVSLGVPPKGADKCFTRQYSAFTRVAHYYNFIDQSMIR